MKTDTAPDQDFMELLAAMKEWQKIVGERPAGSLGRYEVRLYQQMRKVFGNEE